ncbi:serine acetyltransferase [Alteromonas sp. ALT199]|uniref:serine O-acetyltransferase n=1 Tax=unclassified Alteromonas TaxID=2614992 RepID=UPI001BE507E2|nr:serine acetyltransferase [Alteromonas sp. ALT199]MBT3137231.1 serine acetyltransferase [Alteromonas sp. ALT199]
MRKESSFKNFKSDLARAGGLRALLREQSIYPIAWYRFGRFLMSIKNPKIRRFVLIPYYFLFRFIELIFGISLPPEAQIGGGLRIWHFGQIFINSETIIGEDCTLRQNVTIGSKVADGPAPVIGNNVDIGAGAMLIGEINIEDNCRIGAMSLINKNVPCNSIAYGIPMEIRSRETK